MDINEQGKKANNNPLKHVRWDESTTGFGESSNSFNVNTKRQKESFYPGEIVTKLNNLFTKKDYKIANYYILKHGNDNKEQILSAENYALFKRAALRSDFSTLQFIYSKVGDELTRKMIKDDEYAALENFLTKECSSKSEKEDQNNRINIFKFFIQIGGEEIKDNIEKKLNNFKISEDTKNYLQKDFKEACAGLEKEAAISSSSSGNFVDKYKKNRSSSPSLVESSRQSSNNSIIR
ncbi:hypothetical protein NOVO_00225 [Rickettsiales bacterium Ac37b]|nr:hypothetical protein NOVO_00225 [Rickettsiales bacterium Ac37b]